MALSQGVSMHGQLGNQAEILTAFATGCLAAVINPNFKHSDQPWLWWLWWLY